MGNVIGHIAYDGKDSRDFGVIVSSLGTHVAPQRVVENVVIPGRNGTLTIDMERFENITLSYIGMILNNFPENFDAFKAWLCSCRGYKRLEDSFDPSHYRLAKVHDIIEPSVITWDAAGKFEIPFDCDPRRFLKDGDNEIQVTTGSHNLYNPTNFNAKPLIRLSGTMYERITINGKAITLGELTSVTGDIYIDLESMNAYNGSTNINNKVEIANNIALYPGDNDITVEGLLNYVYITPRWWIV